MGAHKADDFVPLGGGEAQVAEQAGTAGVDADDDGVTAAEESGLAGD